MRPDRGIIVAIPVKDEEARIGACIGALIAQTVPCGQLVLLLNNCTDGTLAACQAAARMYPWIMILERRLEGELACAGEARRLVLDYAAAISGDGVVLTTDADARPDPFWIANNMFEFARGADVVCGAAAMDPADCGGLPRGLHFDELRENFLLQLLDEISALVDGDLVDPWPRHQQHSGASIALRAAVLRRAGGAPRVASGEDRALVERLMMVDAKIRHAPNIVVHVSGRLEGRAAGGMAATLKRRADRRDELMDERLEPAVDAFRRALARSRLRAVRLRLADAAALARDLLVEHAVIEDIIRMRYFGAGWAELQRRSPVLQRRRVAFADLARETRQALALRDQLREDVASPFEEDLQFTGSRFAG